MSTSFLRVPPLFLPIAVALMTLHLGFCGLLWFAPKVSLLIAPVRIQSEAGKAYYAAVEFGTRLAYRVPSDSSETPTASNLTVFEDAHTLGPPHSTHIDISQKGDGRFSHWGTGIIFSASDGTDPRSNGRTYSVSGSTELKPALKIVLLTFLSLADLVFVVLFRKNLLLFIERRGAHLLAAFAVLLVAFAGLSASGSFGTIVVAKDGPPKDIALLIQIVQHALLGCCTSIGIWAGGAGIMRLIIRDRRAPLAVILIPAFPVSVVMLAVLVVVALIVPWGRPVAFALWLACLLPLCHWRPSSQQITAALKVMLAIFPLAAAFGIWLALLWHGPTNTLAGTPSGDLVYYAGSMWSLAAQPYPYFDLGYANNGAVSYFNALYSALGAVLLSLPNFDPFLFLLASGGASYVLLSGLMLHLYVTDRGRRLTDPFDILLLTLSVVVAARYPYWVAESIPMVFVPALTIAVWWMAERGRNAFPWALTAMLAGLTGSILSKVVTGAVLVPLGSIGVWRRFRSLPQWAMLAVLAIGAVFLVYSAFMLIRFVPVFIGNAEPGPESYRTPHWYFFIRDIGAVLMVAAAWMVAAPPVALVLTFGIISFLAFSWIFQANFVCVSIVLGLLLISTRITSNFARMLAFVAFALSLPALIFGDQASASSGIVWLLCLGGATLVAVLGASSLVMGSPRPIMRMFGSIAMTTLVVTALGLVGVARSSIIVDSGWHLTQRMPLTPAVKEVWSAVREHTPRTALIFTDQVDETENILGGWNTYAYSGQRQLYLSSYFTNPELRRNRAKLEQVLAINRAVLDGQRLPQSVPTERSYSSFYAVVSVTRAVPSGWRPVFRNSQYALYEIAG